jgi:iron complex transport system permease protein
LVVLIVLGSVLHVALGSSDVMGTDVYHSVSATLREILRGPQELTDASNSIVWQVRLPRVATCMLVGAILGTVGSAFQALLRNPLADPYIVGVSSGSAVGGAIAIVAGVGTGFGRLGIALPGFVTGALTLAIVYRISVRAGVVDVKTLLLAGVVIGSLLASVLSMILLVAGRDERDVLHFILGDTSSSGWPQVTLLAVSFLLGFGVLLVQTRRLNAFAIGSAAAQRLGVDVHRLTRVVLLAGGGMTAAAVGTVGIIGFVGLAAPHIARSLTGVDWRWSLPASAATGCLLLIVADAIAQRAFAAITHTPGFDLPVGIVTSVLGAPSLLILLRRTR